MKMSQQHHTRNPKQHLMQHHHRQLATPNCLGCARCGRPHNATCKKRKMMFGSEMRGALYNSATRGQPDGVVQPHEDPQDRRSHEVSTEQQNTASSSTTSLMTAAMTAATRSVNPSQTMASTTTTMSTTPLCTPPQNLRRRLIIKRPAKVQTDACNTAPCPEDDEQRRVWISTDDHAMRTGAPDMDDNTTKIPGHDNMEVLGLTGERGDSDIFFSFIHALMVSTIKDTESSASR